MIWELLDHPRLNPVIAALGLLVAVMGVIAPLVAKRGRGSAPEPIIETVTTADSPWPEWTNIRLRVLNPSPATMEIVCISAPRWSGAKITLNSRLPRITKTTYHESWMRGGMMARKRKVLTSTPPHNVNSHSIDGIDLRIKGGSNRKAVVDVSVAPGTDGKARPPRRLTLDYIHHDQRHIRRRIKLHV